MLRRIHISGASGSGVSTLGTALAKQLQLPLFDCDDYYWLPSNPPYQHKRAIADRLTLLQHAMCDEHGWVFAGSADGWAQSIEPRYQAVIFLDTPNEVRLSRLLAREQARYGDRLLPGGDMEQSHQDFMAWAAGYESNTASRNRGKHEQWLHNLHCPWCRLDGGKARTILLGEALGWLGKLD